MALDNFIKSEYLNEEYFWGTSCCYSLVDDIFVNNNSDWHYKKISDSTNSTK